MVFVDNIDNGFFFKFLLVCYKLSFIVITATISIKQFTRFISYLFSVIDYLV